MTKISKIKEHDHELEAKNLRDEGHGWIEISNIFNKKYPEDGGYSHMAIKRGLDSYGRSIVEHMIDDGINPIVELENKFNKAIDKNIKEVEKLIKYINQMIKDTEKDGTYNDRNKTVMTALKAWERHQKAWESLKMNTGREMDGIRNVSFTKEQDIRILINNWTDGILELKKELCSECKKVADEFINNFLQKLIKNK